MKVSLRLKSVLYTLMVAVIIAATAGVISYQDYSSSMFSDYTNMTTNLSKAIAGLMDQSDVEQLRDEVMAIYEASCEDNGGPDALFEMQDVRAEEYFAQYSRVEETPAFQRVMEKLETSVRESDATGIYIGFTDLRTGYCVYLADGSDDKCLPGTLDVIEQGELESAMEGDYGFEPHITNYEQYGWLCTVGTGIYNEAGEPIGTLCVDISMDEVVREQQAFLRQLLTILAVVTLVLILISYAGINAGIVNPVNALSDATASFVSDQSRRGQGESAISRLNIRTKDEIEKLCHSVQTMEQELNSYITNLTQVTAEKERIGAELNVATHIQASMLPCIFPAFPDRHEIKIYATMTPAKEVGGDFYDFFWVDDDHMAVVIADVSGKGVPAALFMVIAKTLIKNQAQTGTAPETVFNEVNRQLCESNEENLFVTAWMAVLEISTGKATFVNAGHNPPLIGRAGEGYEFLKSSPGFVLAGLEMTKYKSGTFEMRPGDFLYLYTDGVTEAINASEEQYGDKRLKDTLNAHMGDVPEELLPEIKADLDAFVRDVPQFDDITMVSLQYVGPKG